MLRRRRRAAGLEELGGLRRVVGILVGLLVQTSAARAVVAGP
ncbi:hypothetical protein AB0M46_48445 [Dactylosporangium sp. NPDC051485]